MLNIVLSIVFIILFGIAGIVSIIAIRAFLKSYNEMLRVRTKRSLGFEDYKSVIFLGIGTLVSIAGVFGSIFGFIWLWNR